MKRVLILGGGFGGIATAVALRRRLAPGDEVVLVERRASFVMGLRKNWAFTGVAPFEGGQRGLWILAEQGIHVVSGKVNEIFPAQVAAEVDTSRIDADAMVVALGAGRDRKRIPGFEAHAIDYYDPREAVAGAEAIDRFRGGRVVIGIFGAPYPCPPAPYELALLLAERFGRSGIGAEITVVSPQPVALPIVGQAASAAFEATLADAGIAFRPSTQVLAIEPGQLVPADGSRIPFDLLIGVAPHRVPGVVAQSGLTHGAPWVHVDRETLETAFPDVYAIGDVTGITLANGMSLPKSGAFAHAEGETVAARIASRFAGEVPASVYDGTGTCFMETGQGRAAAVSGRFYADPPQVVLSEGSAEGLAAKQAFEADRLRDWFGW